MNSAEQEDTDRLIHQRNLKMSWRLMHTEHWTDEQREQLYASAFEQCGTRWIEEIQS